MVRERARAFSQSRRDGTFLYMIWVVFFKQNNPHILFGLHLFIYSFRAAWFSKLNINVVDAGGKGVACMVVMWSHVYAFCFFGFLFFISLVFGFGFSLYKNATTFYAKSFIIYRCWMLFFIFYTFLAFGFCVWCIFFLFFSVLSEPYCALQHT